MTVGSLGRFRRLLDDFCEMVPAHVRAATAAPDASQAGILERLANLLESFARTRGGATDGDPTSDEPPRSVDIAAAQALLDEFARLRGPSADVDPIIRFQTLLDEFSRAQTNSGSLT